MYTQQTLRYQYPWAYPQSVIEFLVVEAALYTNAVLFSEFINLFAFLLLVVGVNTWKL